MRIVDRHSYLARGAGVDLPSAPLPPDRRNPRLPALALAAAVSLSGATGSSPSLAQPTGAPAPRMVLERASGATADAGWEFGVLDVEAAALAAAARRAWSSEQWRQVLSVHVEHEDAPAILGGYRVDARGLWFRPAFPAERGVRYVAVFRPAALAEPLAEVSPRGSVATHAGVGAASPPTEPIRARLLLTDATAAASPATVSAVYPSTREIPENLLRFYVHFSAPMSRGDALRWIRLEDAGGEAIPMTFLELAEELWDRDGRRLTLLLDPGRVKSGLRPRAELGRALETGRSVALVIDGRWPDAAGRPLAATWRGGYRVVGTDPEPPDPARWRLTPPPAGTRVPLAVALDEPLDHALLHRLLWIEDDEGRRLAGTIEVGEQERSWGFVPRAPWRAGAHSLRVDRRLEDRAGNRVGRPFEVDLTRGRDARAEPSDAEPVTIRFEVGSRQSPSPVENGRPGTSR